MHGLGKDEGRVALVLSAYQIRPTCAGQSIRMAAMSQDNSHTCPRRAPLRITGRFSQMFASALMAGAVVMFLPTALAKKKEAIQHAPLPAAIIAAKTVYIQNESNFPDIADKAYTVLKRWGRYQVVDSKEKADLILVFTIAHSTTQGNDPAFVSLYNSKTGAYTYGTVPGGTSTLTWSWTQMRILDSKTGDVMWADQQIWLRKRSATEIIVQSFRTRVDEQDKQPSH